MDRSEAHLNAAQRFVLSLIRWYQRTLSPDHGPQSHRYPLGYCRYTPTCSEYGHEAVRRYGVLIGGFKALWRVLRCNPWSGGGYDPVK